MALTDTIGGQVFPTWDTSTLAPEKPCTVTIQLQMVLEEATYASKMVGDATSITSSPIARKIRDISSFLDTLNKTLKRENLPRTTL
jgi:hypothetical protein